MAARHRITDTRHDHGRFIDRFESNSRVIASAYRVITAAVHAGEPVAPTAEWVLDNYHIIEEQLREIREDLPRRFYRELPKLAEGDWTGFPRVYEVGHELVVHTDSSLNQELIAGFVEAYQRTSPMTSGELWAVPIMLRLVLVENLRRLCGHITAGREYRQQAQKLLETWRSASSTAGVAETRAHAPPVVMHLIDNLRGSNPEEHGLILADVASRFGRGQDEIDEIVRNEQQRLAADQVSIGNIVTSMQLLNGLDWKVFFERVSLVEQVLREDPAGVYEHLEFSSRDQYRHVVEELAKRSCFDEIGVAEAAIDYARAADRQEASDVRRRHVGFFLLDEGRRELEAQLQYRPRWGESVSRLAQRQASIVYMGGISLLTVTFAVAIQQVALALSAPPWIAGLAGLLALLPASDLAIGLVNVMVTNLFQPQALPKIEFTDQIPAHCQSLVVIPSLLTSEQGIRALLERLEIHYLTNPERGLQFALLTDFGDASAESLPADKALLEQARAGIEVLNGRHPDPEGARFHLLHRRRLWNPLENVWMGWERKRGKLVELNRLLRGDRNTSYVETGTLLGGPTRIRYVITLDADSRLPHGVAKRLIGTLAHPLNRPHFDTALHRVTRGFGILQPRVTVSLASAVRSRFSKIFANSPGLDPYSVAVSDVYQDLFGEGSFMGKGIYDVDAFAAAVDDTFPENHILSHDLIEGCFARVGMVTDIELFDEYPTRFDAEARRQHRWVRGDWQLLPWLLPTVPTTEGRRANPLSLLSRWKVFDNLRRSLVLPVLLACLLLAWLAFPPLAGLATLFATIVVATHVFARALSLLMTWPHGTDWRGRLRELVIDLSRTLVQSLLALVFLPYKAELMLDAAARTLYRLCVSRRKLLEWETADAAERRFKDNPWLSVWEMKGGASLALLSLFILPHASHLAAAPLLVAWILSPLVAYWISRPTVRAIKPLEPFERQELRRLARKTWAFFEAFVTLEEHWLPPDNFQEFPRDKIAHRVSPTNEGLLIISAAAAYDFGFLGLSDLVTLLERNLQTLEQLDRHRGHFYNWYVTTNLAALPPRYISTADSGNLAACFMTASQALRDFQKLPLLSDRTTTGIIDTVILVEESLARLQPRGARFGGTALTALEECLRDIRMAAEARPADILEWARLIEKLHAAARVLPDRLQAFQSPNDTKHLELSKKIAILINHLGGLQQDNALFFSWVNIVDNGTQKSSVGTNGVTPAVTWAAANENAWQTLWSEMKTPLTLQRLAALHEWATPHIEALREANSGLGHDSSELQFETFAGALQEASRQALEFVHRLDQLADRYYRLAMDMDFTLTYDAQRKLFSVGYNLDEGRLDAARYDLLASEARIASLVAIAKGDVDHRHWFQLGRTLTETEGARALLSWGGTMFEFLMPTLFVHDVEGSLLDQSCRAAVEHQIAYGRKCHVPWGISESAFSAQGANTDYHYQSFGVPGLGLKRGLARDLVISPYSTTLAAEIDPAAAAANLRDLIAEGAEGEWGLYDALDYTPSRVAADERRNVVYCYMAHHHGMTMAAIANCLLDRCMQRRFQRQPQIRAVDLLLQERVPVAVLQFQPQADEATPVPALPDMPGAVSRRLSTAATAVPRLHLLSNGRYSVMLTNSGGGYSVCRSLAVSRWRPDATRDNWGQFLYLRNVDTGLIWSAGFQPTRAVPDAYEVTFAIDKVEIRRLDGNIETMLEIAVSPENDAEVRQVTLRNYGKRPAVIEVTSFLELVLSPAAADLAHPAFNKLFVETEYLDQRRALLACRRPRDAEQKPVWAVHVLAIPEGIEETVEFETDRAQFIGRGRTAATPVAMDRNARLSGTTGPVLDPIFSLRHRLALPPGGAASLAFTTAFADSREEALLLADQYHDARVVQRTFELAWANSQIEMNRLKLSPASSQLFQRLASATIYPDPAWRAPPQVLKANRLGQSSLWRHGISGDDPLVIVGISEPDHRGLLRELLLAHEFWHAHGLKVDLVVLNERPAGYFDTFHEQLLEQIQTTVHSPINKSGGVYLLRAAHLAEEDKTLLHATAAVNLSASRGSLARQIESASEPPKRIEPPALRPARKLPRPAPARSPAPLPEARPDLRFPNPFGGFAAEGHEYVVRLRAGEWTPAPWVNCIANPDFGCLVSEAGGGYTWAGNSRENKLTAWSNDPVADAPGEMIYLRDEESGVVWSPTPLPIRDNADYTIAHGHGYSQFTHTAEDIHCELLLSIALSESVKFVCLKLRNASPRPRSISVTYYAEWVLGDTRERTQTQVWTAVDDISGALLACNPAHEVFPNQVAFLHVLDRRRTVTGDRTEFIGRNRNFSNPATFERIGLSGTTGAGLDPCGAMQTRLSLAPGEETEVIFLVGQVAALEKLAGLLAKFKTAQQVQAAIQATIEFWKQTLRTVQVTTPNPAFDLLVNGWLLYQTLSCRIWGRSAFYQSGGAYGFRDQLQDVMALVYSLPLVAREHILRAAARQFEQGDVQHWWHPPTGRGVRTRFSDDYLWLPFVASHYISTTGDMAILNAQVPFLRSALLAPQEEERYELPETTTETADLYTHCLRAIDHGMRFGVHGLPLMGSGDWNDGMNRVGILGQGESVWVAWFLIVVLRRFAPLAEAHGDHERAVACRAQADALLNAIEQNAWDGAWYRRAYYDNGEPLGSATNEECRIDSLAQSWAVIAGGQPQRVRQAMRAVDEHLVRDADRLVLLFTPPFDKSAQNPGYIKGYLPGIRENGGQYTHAALWVILAQTGLGNGTRALELFNLLNPIVWSSDPQRTQSYRVEPYVVAADVYSRPPHVGRGGWTWYTGSAAWMYRVALESILGIDLQGNHLRVNPCIPAAWTGFEVVMRRGSATWRIKVNNPSGVERGVRQVKVNGQLIDNGEIQLADRDGEQLVEVEMGFAIPR